MIFVELVTMRKRKVKITKIIIQCNVYWRILLLVVFLTCSRTEFTFNFCLVLEFFYTGETSGRRGASSLTCPYCAQAGFTPRTLMAHCIEKHSASSVPSKTDQVVVCKIFPLSSDSARASGSSARENFRPWRIDPFLNGSVNGDVPSEFRCVRSVSLRQRIEVDLVLLHLLIISRRFTTMAVSVMNVIPSLHRLLRSNPNDRQKKRYVERIGEARWMTKASSSSRKIRTMKRPMRTKTLHWRWTMSNSKPWLNSNNVVRKSHGNVWWTHLR